MSTVGLITYHAAYNYGSVLQAFATQTAVESLGHDVTIVDYRPVEGDRFYKRLYRWQMGPKALAADLTMLPVQGMRMQRMRRFEQFIASRLHLSQHAYREPGRLRELADAFDVTVSGSDQIINKHSNELERVDWRYMAPYLLEWSHARRISYASSPATMSDDDLRRIAAPLRAFDAISVREGNANAKLAALTGKPVTTVCDPTLLLDSRRWIEEFPDLELPLELLPHTGRRYLLFYSLLRPRRAAGIFAELKRLSHRIGMPIAVLTPLAGRVPACDELVNVLESGPGEFLALVDGAQAVLTDSYHGTLFSINFHKPFWTFTEHTVEEELQTRKGQILAALGLDDRIATDIGAIDTIQPVEYAQADHALERLRNRSYDYLRTALHAPGEPAPPKR